MQRHMSKHTTWTGPKGVLNDYRRCMSLLQASKKPATPPQTGSRPRAEELSTTRELGAAGFLHCQLKIASPSAGSSLNASRLQARLLLPPEPTNGEQQSVALLIVPVPFSGSAKAPMFAQQDVVVVAKAVTAGTCCGGGGCGRMGVAVTTKCTRPRKCGVCICGHPNTRWNCCHARIRGTP